MDVKNDVADKTVLERLKRGHEVVFGWVNTRPSCLIDGRFLGVAATMGAAVVLAVRAMEQVLGSGVV